MADLAAQDTGKSSASGGSSALKPALYAVGAACFVLSCVYVAFAVWDNWSAIAAKPLDARFFDWLPLVIAGYAASLLTTSLAWPAILARLGKPLPVSTGMLIGLTTQVGKYLPGNIAHAVGRAALAKRRNIELSLSGVSTLVEYGAAAIAAVLIAFTGFALSADIRLFVDEALPGAVFRNAILIGSVGAGAGALVWIYSSRNALMAQLLRPRLWVSPVGWLCCSFVLAGLSFHALALAIDQAGQISLLAATSIYAVAWIAGFLMPGAPAGLGVRETVLLGLLTPLTGPANAVLLTLAHRLITALTDGLVAAIAAGLYLYTGTRNAD
jgi:uncharacterized membrane protein YbhN (UPF0104 family)